VIISAVFNHADSPSINEFAVDTLLYLCSSDRTNQKRLVEANGVGIIVDCMKKHPHQVKVQSNVCGLLWVLSSDADDVKRLVADGGGITLMLETMKEHSNDMKVVKNACGALACLSSNNAPIKKQLIEGGGVGLILSCLKEHPKNAGVAQWGLAALINLTADSGDAKTADLIGLNGTKESSTTDVIAEAGGLELILAMMKIHISNVSVVKNACGALVNLLETSVENHKIVNSAGGLKTISEVVTRHMSDANVVEWGLECIMFLVDDNLEYQIALKENGGMELMKKIQQKYPKKKDVLELAHEGLKNMNHIGEVKKQADEYKLKGNKALEEGKTKEAIELYGKAIDVGRGSDYSCYSYRSAGYLMAGDYENAIKDADHCISLNPNVPEEYRRKGAILISCKKYDDAIATYRKGLAKFPNNVDLILSLSQANDAKAKAEDFYSK